MFWIPIFNDLCLCNAQNCGIGVIYFHALPLEGMFS